MKKKKSRKKLLIGAGVLIVVAVGGVSAFGKMSSGEEMVPQVEVVKAEIGDVQQTVEASGTVVSEESKTYFSPVNARVDKVDFKEGDIVKAGTELVAFDRKDLEREEKKAELNVESGKLDMQNTLNKSDKAVQKQKDAQGNAASLKQQVAAQEDYVASLKAQISQVTANAQVQAAAEAADKAAREKAAQEAARQKLQQEYNADLSTYQTRTLPEYQNKLNELNNEMNQALLEYNQAESEYQMAFQTWSADQSDENAEALSVSEQLRSESQIGYQEAKSAYEDYKTQKPAAPVLSDYTGESSAVVSDGTAGADFSSDSSDSTDVAVTADTSALESALEKASSDLAELQSRLASEQAAAETDPGAVTEEEKKKMERISCSRPVYDRSCCIFGDFGMLLDTIQYNCHVGGREIYSTFHASYFWNRQFRKGYFFKSDAGIGNNACDQHIGRPFFNCGRCFVRSIYRIFRRHFR